MKFIFDFDLPENTTLKVERNGAVIMSQSIPVSKEMLPYLRSRGIIRLNRTRKYYNYILSLHLRDLSYDTITRAYNTLKTNLMIDCRKAKINVNTQEIGQLILNYKYD